MPDITWQQFIVFSLVLVRVSGLMVVSPVYGTNEVPTQVRALLAFALSLLVAPTQLATPLSVPSTLAGYLVQVGGEALVGLTLGLGVNVLFSGIQLAGAIVGQASGMTLADVFNPGFDTSIPLVSHLLYLLALMVYVTIGGHRLLLAGLLGTFAAIPPGGAGLPLSLVDAATTLLTQSFVLGIRAAAPATAALLLATLVLGLISRTLPQLNVMSLGFGLNSLVALGLLLVSVGSVAWLFQEEIAPAIDTLLDVFASG